MKPSRRRPQARFVSSALLAVLSLGAAGAEPPVDFQKEIRPLFEKRCHSCHGEREQKGGLRLDRRADAHKGGDSGPAFEPGKSTGSELLRRVQSTDPDEFMPPKGERFSTREIALLARWIDEGAAWPEETAAPKALDGHKNHWAWKKTGPAKVPHAMTQEWAANPIDRFILARLEAEGRGPSPPAEKPSLLRRACFDLHGLPPTLHQTREFLDDDAPGAFERLVDRLLASPRYGERWGRHWMDVVRYADTAGDNADYPIPEARLYRDYIIDAFNADKRYDQFIVEQLAGDILAGSGPAEHYAERIIATGFLALSRRYATAPFELMHLTIEDAIETTGRTFLGLTLRCARCHDHKFDPMTMEDYYGLYGVFASTQFPYAGSEEFQSKKRPRTGFVPLLPPEAARPRLEEADRKIRGLAEQIKSAKSRLEKTKKKSLERSAIEKEIDRLETEHRRLVRRGAPADLPVAYAVVDARPVEQPIHRRGEPEEPGPAVPRRAPRFFAGDAPLEIAGRGSGRLELARWIANRENPLAAKVMVNRIWHHHFGQGLVRTPSNFGILGEAPSHPELLDWLADYFVDQGWSIKAMHRLILTSATWRQSSGQASDRLLGGFPRRRLDAEAIRDAMMLLAGNLDLRRPGEHPFPQIGRWNWTQHNPFKAVYDSPHRSVYLMRQRLQRHPDLALFDAPDANASTDVRTSATVPQQALFLLNHPFVGRQASGFARRILAASRNDEERIAFAVQHAWSRPARADDRARARAFLDRFAAEARRTGLPEQEAISEAWTSYARVLLSSNEFFFVD